MNFSVCGAPGATATAALCAVATAGSNNPAVAPRTAAAPAAAKGARSFMICFSCLRGITGPSLWPMIRPAGLASQGPCRAGGAEPCSYPESPGHGGGLDVADLPHPPEVQLQVRPPGGQPIQAAFGAPGQGQRGSDP